MKEDLIVTKSKKEFLQHEYKDFPDYKTFNDFMINMVDFVKSCKKCDVIYWQGCALRCECESQEKDICENVIHHTCTYFNLYTGCTNCTVKEFESKY
jgi:hypothetical protein